MPISVTTAALGGEFQVPTIDGGKQRVKVPDGTQTGKQFRLKGKGMPVLRSSRVGDMYIQVVVETPRNLSRRQRELLEEFESASSAETHPEFDRLLRAHARVLRRLTHPLSSAREPCDAFREAPKGSPMPPTSSASSKAWRRGRA